MSRVLIAVALVALISSCSQKGFQRQRYTHYRHSHKVQDVVKAPAQPHAEERNEPIETVNVPPSAAGMQSQLVVNAIAPHQKKPAASAAAITRQAQAPLAQQASLEKKANKDKVSTVHDPAPFFFLADLLGLFNFPGGTIVSILITVAIMVVLVMMFA